MEFDQDPSEQNRAQEKETHAVAVYDSLTAYLAEVRKYPFLSREEEFRLSVQYREKGDLDAVARLVMANLQVVVNIAMEYKRVSVPTLDLIQEGNIGLMLAVKRFDPYRGTRLSTYAAWWIRAYILRYIMKNWRMVKIGTTEEERRLFFNLRKEKERLEALGFGEAPKLLADRLEIKERKLLEMNQRLEAVDLSLDETLGEAEDGLKGVIPVADQPVDQAYEEKELNELLQEKLRLFKTRLNARDLEILEDRILGDPPKTLQSIANRHQISKERVRQLEKQLDKKLKIFLKKEFKSSHEGKRKI